MLILFDFKGMFVISDGAQSNRNFMHTLLPDFSMTNPTISSVKNIYSADLNDVFFSLRIFPKGWKKFEKPFTTVERTITVNAI